MEFLDYFLGLTTLTGRVMILFTIGVWISLKNKPPRRTLIRIAITALLLILIGQFGHRLIISRESKLGYSDLAAATL